MKFRRPLFRAGFAAWARAACALAVTAALTLLSAPLQAQGRQEKGKQLIDESLEALGGKAFLNVRNVVRTGRAYSFYRADLRGLAVMTIYERFEPMRTDVDPDWLPVSRREVYTEEGDYYALFVNGKGWEVTFRGARPYAEDRLARYQEATRRDFFYWLRYRLDEPGLYFYHKGIEIIDNVPTDAVEIADQEGESITVYLRQSDRLPVQQIYTRRDPKTRIPYEEKSVFSKYRRVGEVMLPWNLRHERDGVKTLEIFGRTVTVNEDLGPQIFALAKGLTVLPVEP